MGEKCAKIFDIQRASFVDGPGIRTAIFFYGCNLRCKWCHNPEGLGIENIALPEEYKYKEYTANELLDIVSEDKLFYDTDGGVTVTGGECMLRSDFLADFLALCKRNGIHTAVDTAGNVPFEDFEKTTEYTDLFLYDIKSVTSDLHKEFTGVGNELILCNYKKLIALGMEITVRIPFIPGFNDKPDEIQKIYDFLSRYTPKSIELLPYHTMGIGKYEKLGIPYKRFEVPSSETVEKYRKFFQQLTYRQGENNYE